MMRRLWEGTLVMILMSIGLASQASAQFVIDRTKVRVPVNVTIYKESSFVREWGAGADQKATQIFNEVATYYRNNFGLELRLERIDTPFFSTENGTSGEPTKNGTILRIMRANLRATFVPGKPPKSGVPSNWLLIHRDIDLQGQVDTIGAQGTLYPNLYINTRQRPRAEGEWSDGTSPREGGETRICSAAPARRSTNAEVRLTGIHEFGHMLGAKHLNPSKCTHSVMCVNPDENCGRNGWEQHTVSNAMDSMNAQRVRSHIACMLTTNVPGAPAVCGF